MNLENRLRKALAALEELNAPQPHVYRRPDEERLRGKIEGVKLALSYLEEEVELDRIAALEVGHEYYAAWVTSRTCGDYPAPCNCDDPRTHNGH